MDDLTELLKRIYEYSEAYRRSGFKAPLFRLTPYEFKIFLDHIIVSDVNYRPQYFGDLPRYFGVAFEIVGKPVLFCGMHVRSDSATELPE